MKSIRQLRSAQRMRVTLYTQYGSLIVFVLPVVIQTKAVNAIDDNNM